MVSLLHLSNSLSWHRYRRPIALAQLLLMVMLAVPVCCYELTPGHEDSVISFSAPSRDAAPDNSPCCPAENRADADNCSTCGYCFNYAAFAPERSPNYYPAVSHLLTGEPFTKWLDVQIPIFVPPQNLV